MRFDGYFILMDFLRLPNLSTRSLAYVKYLFMNGVLGFSHVSNPATTTRETTIFTVYGVCAFLYRLFLYGSIVLGVYYRFDKLFGVLLGLLALVLFVLRPIFKGVKTVVSQRKNLQPRLRGVAIFGGLILCIVLVLLIPVSSKSVYPCYLASAKTQKLTVPLQTSVDQVFVTEGSSVSGGQVLFTLDTSRLKTTFRQKENQLAILEKETTFFRLDDKTKEKAVSKEIEISQLRDEIRKIGKDLFLSQEGVVAPFDGIVTSLDYRLQKGFQPGEGTIVGELESQADCVVHVLIPEKDLHKIHVGEAGEVWFHSDMSRLFTGSVREIKAHSERDLKNSPFSSRYGGELATEVKEEGESDAPLEAQYTCTVTLINVKEPFRFGTTGRLVLRSAPRSLLAAIAQRVVNTFNRESLF
jgi:putative peptide zinc metalloprotease protein